jgi:hypothetical protein
VPDDRTPEQDAYSFGALAGPWFDVGGGLLSFTAGPGVGIMTEAIDTASRTRGDFLAQLAMRYVLPVGDRWKPALALDVDSAPFRMLHPTSGNELAFPTWSAALRFGIVGGSP